MKNIEDFYQNILSYFIDKNGNGDFGNLFEEKVKVEIESFILNFIIKGKFINPICLNKLKQKNEKFKNLILEEDFGLETSTASMVDEMTSIFDDFYILLLQFLNITQAQLKTSTHIVHQRHVFIETEKTLFNEFCEYLNLFILDISISDNISFYEKLNELFKRYELEHKIKPFKYKNIFNHKINFLKYKWLKRQKYNRIFLQKVIRGDYSEKIVFNEKIIDLDSKILIGDPYYETYKDWIDKIDYHYFDERKENFKFLTLSFNKKNSLDFYDLYLRIKTYKDIEKSIDDLKSLQGDFRALKLDEIDNHLKNKNTLYYYNNCFSLLCDVSENPDEVTKEYNRLKKISRFKSNHNFFIHYKYLDFIVNYFEENIQLLNEKYSFEELYNIMDVCNSNFKWSIRGFNRVYDFSFKESLVEIDGHNVYHASSFSLPLSIDENQYYIDNVENKLRRLQNKYQVKVVENKTEKIVDEIKDLNKKSLETITIFTAIISFIVGTIGVFKFIESFFQALLFILVFGVSISIFVFLIFLSTKGLVKMKEYKWQIAGVYTFVLLLIAGISCAMEFKEQNIITQQESFNTKPVENLEIKKQEEINIQKPLDQNIDKENSST